MIGRFGEFLITTTRQNLLELAFFLLIYSVQKLKPYKIFQFCEVMVIMMTWWREQRQFFIPVGVFGVFLDG